MTGKEPRLEERVLLPASACIEDAVDDTLIQGIDQYMWVVSEDDQALVYSLFELPVVAFLVNWIEEHVE